MITIEQELDHIVANARKYLANDKNMRAKTSIIKNCMRLEWIAESNRALKLKKFLGNLWQYALIDKETVTPVVRRGMKARLLKDLEASIPEIESTNWPAPIIEI